MHWRIGAYIAAIQTCLLAYGIVVVRDAAGDPIDFDFVPDRLHIPLWLDTHPSWVFWPALVSLMAGTTSLWRRSRKRRARFARGVWIGTPIAAALALVINAWFLVSAGWITVGPGRRVLYVSEDVGAAALYGLFVVSFGLFPLGIVGLCYLKGFKD